MSCNNDATIRQLYHFARDFRTKESPLHRSSKPASRFDRISLARSALRAASALM